MPVRVFYQNLVPGGIWRQRDAERAEARGRGRWAALGKVAAVLESARFTPSPRHRQGRRLIDGDRGETIELRGGVDEACNISADAAAGAGDERVLILARAALPGDRRAARGMAAIRRRNRLRDAAARGEAPEMVRAAGAEAETWIRSGRPWRWE